MKQKELTKEEKEVINGGNTSFSSGSEINIGSDSLLSLTHSYKTGERQTTHKLEVGKDIDIDLGGNLNRTDGN